METNAAPAAPTAPAHGFGRPAADHLRQSEIFRSYHQAYEAATGLPLALRAAGSFQSPLHGSKLANPFCTLMAGTNKTCAACLQLQQRVEEQAPQGARTLKCFAGLSESAVPIRTGENILGYLQTGQVFLKKPTPATFRRVRAHLAQQGVAFDDGKLRASYFKTRVIPQAQYESVVRLLAIFAQHLSAMSNQVLVQETTAENPVITRARAYIADHQGEDLALRSVAAAMHVSTFHFCKIFKQSTSLTFTDYLARVRVENVKQKMLNPHLRVSEIAYAAGFQSLSQFNRVFHRIVGESPTRFRAKLPAGPSGRAYAQAA